MNDKELDKVAMIDELNNKAVHGNKESYNKIKQMIKDCAEYIENLNPERYNRIIG